MKDKMILGLIPGILAPFLIVLLFWIFRFRYLDLSEFIRQAFFLRIQFKIMALGIFFADLALFYLFLHLDKTAAAKGVILAVFLYFLLFLFLAI